MSSPLVDIMAALECGSTTWPHNKPYYVPSVLEGGFEPSRMIDIGNPYFYFRNVINKILTAKVKSRTSRLDRLNVNDIVYSTFIRTFATCNFEIGSALKLIIFLPFLVERYNITTVITLPPCVIGQTQKKGIRGSPFAVKDPFAIDPSLGDPLLPTITPDKQYHALIEAAHCMGLKIGSIVPLTVLSLDSPLFREHPALGYWWTAQPGEKLFADILTDTDIEGRRNGKSKIDISSLTKSLFVEPPNREQIFILQKNDTKYTCAKMKIGGQEKIITLANAVPDPIAGRKESYTWSDVAAIRYTHSCIPPFQGVHNSVIWDKSLPSFKIMPEVLKHRLEFFDEDLALIDVNQSVPMEIIEKALSQCSTNRNGKKNHPKYSLRNKSVVLEELWNFDKQDNRIADAVLGPLIFCVGPHSNAPEKMHNSLKYHLQLLTKRKQQNFYFAGIGNHDTRPVNVDFISMLMLFQYLLPGSIPFVFSGQEYGAETTINKEFGFDLLNYDNALDDNNLPLFNDIPLNYQDLPSEKRYLELIKSYNIAILLKEYINTFEVEYELIPACNLYYGYKLKSDVFNIDVIISTTNGIIDLPKDDIFLFSSQNTFEVISNTGTDQFLNISSDVCYVIITFSNNMARKYFFRKLINNNIMR